MARPTKFFWYWVLTSLSARRLFAEAFPAENVEIEAHGNVLAVIAFMQGLAVKELRTRGTRPPGSLTTNS